MIKKQQGEAQTQQQSSSQPKQNGNGTQSKEKQLDLSNQNNSLQEDNQEEEQDKSDTYENKVTKNFKQAMEEPVRDQLQKLENIIEQLQKDLEVSKQDLNNLRTGYQGLKSSKLDTYQYLVNQILGERNRIAQDLKKGSQNDIYESDFLSQQIQQLRIDKEKLDQTTEILNLRIQGVEQDVGFRFVYD